MKNLILLSLLFNFSVCFSQSEQLIPQNAITVFSINNLNLLQKISMDDLVKYDFMEEVHQELFDGSTSGKTLKDAGIDFNQRLNVFYGKTDDYEVSGFTFGVNNSSLLFEVFDDFTELKSNYKDVKEYGSFFNNLILKNNSALLIRIEPTAESIDRKTDSIWYSRGNEYPYGGMYEEEILFDEGFDEGDFDFEQNEAEAEEEEEEEEEEELNEDPPFYFDSTEISIEDFPEASEDLNEKNYYELRDSVQLELQQYLLTQLLNDLFINNLTLLSIDPRFSEQLTHQCAGTFYLDNSRSFQQANGLWYFQTIMPSLYNDIKELYTGNVILGDLILNDKSLEFLVEARYGEKLGSIYQEMNDSKFDKNITKYIHKNSPAYFTYNVNLRKAYDKAYEVIMPIISAEKNADIAMNVLALELMNELINKDALFGTCKGSLFGFFNGIKKIKIKKIEYVYDDNFNYIPQSNDAEEDMPIFTFGFSIDRTDIPEKVFKHLERSTLKIVNMGNYWRYDNAILDAAPLYMICKNGLFLFTNDEDLALNHSQGYGDKAISHSDVKKTMKSNLIYTLVDLGTTLKRFPVDLFGSKENQIIESLRGKTGIIQLKTTKAKKKNANIQLTYSDFSDNQTGKHLLDLINAIYVASK